MSTISQRRAPHPVLLKATMVCAAVLILCGVCVLAAGDAAFPAKKADSGSATSASEGDQATEDTDNLSVTADTLDMDFVNKIAVFTGHVEVSDSRMTLKADHMDVYLTPDDDLKRIVATGNVTVHEPASARRATAGKAIYDVIEGTVVLTDTPTIVDGENTVTEADTITYFRDSDKFRFEGGPVFTVKTKKGKKSIMPALFGTRKRVPAGNAEGTGAE